MSDNRVWSVYPDCHAVYFDGQEELGSAMTTVSIDAPDLLPRLASATVNARVWYLDLPLVVSLHNPTLSLVRDWTDPDSIPDWVKKEKAT